MAKSDPLTPKQVRERVEQVSPKLSDIYTDLHSHPELSLQEVNTAAKMAGILRDAGFEVTSGVGGTGVVGVLKNGEGPTVMLRADMDALPVKEESGLPYASNVTATDRSGKTVPVMHACGHDIHMTSVAGASMILADFRTNWSGNLIAVFQPAEEISQGARVMVNDKFYERFPKPDVILGQHVINSPVGTIGWSTGAATTTGDSLMIRLFGRGSHGAMPENSVDPVVMAAAVVIRLQTIVAREVPANEAAIITIGSLQAGTMENVIPDEAVLKVNVRTYDAKIRERVLGAITRIVNAEAAASGAEKPPEITVLNHFDLVWNNPEATRKVVESFNKQFPADQVRETRPTKMSEDFGEFNLGSTIPSVYWFIGGSDPQVYQKYLDENRLPDLPTNHNPKFAPLMHPTLEIGTRAMVAAALAWLAE
ncbi:MAG TPA: amidohydrolase [Anaerolineaceae bacterium]|nr:amidohydrolase [Anaerolineaceae bacterium]